VSFRALRCHGDFDVYWIWHEEQEFARDHQARYRDRIMLVA
jgi:hypothetical protein